MSTLASDRPVYLPWKHIVVLQREVSLANIHQAFWCTLMMKSMPRLPKLVQYLANYVEVFGIKVESDLTQS